MPAAKRVWTQAQDEAIHYRRNTMKESWAAIRDDPIWGDTPPSAKSLKTHYDVLEINHVTSQLQSTIDAAQEKYYHGIDSSQNKIVQPSQNTLKGIKMEMGSIRLKTRRLVLLKRFIHCKTRSFKPLKNMRSARCRFNFREM